MTTPAQKTDIKVSQNNWPCINSVLFTKNWEKDSTVMKIVKIIGTLLIFPLLIAGIFDIVKKGYDFVWTKPEEPVTTPVKTPDRNWFKRKICDNCTSAYSWSANKISNAWTNHKKAILITSGALALGIAWYFGGICKVTGYTCGTPAQPVDVKKG